MKIVTKIYAISFNPNIGLFSFHLPRVKSGIFTDALPNLIDFSLNGYMTLILTESYTSMTGLAPFNDSINARRIKKSIPPCPVP